jgi:general stress protein YciG
MADQGDGKDGVDGVDGVGRKEPEEPRRGMTVSEAGRKGGITVRDERGHAFYEEIGKKGGQKVRELIERGKHRT